MANELDKIVQVVITRQTSVPSMASFNSAIIVDEFLASSVTPVMGTTERVREYGGIDEIVAAGFDEDGYVYKAAAAYFGQNPHPSKLYVGRKLTGADGTETWTTALNAIATENSEWYGLCVSSRTQADQELVAAWTLTNKKLCVLASSDANIINSDGDIADVLSTAENERAIVFYHPKCSSISTDECPDAALLGKMFPKDPGSASWAYKTLLGVSPYVITSAQANTAEGKNAMTYMSIADVSVTRPGKVASGEYIDVIHGIDWLQARIQNRVYTPMVQLDKIPFTDGGVSVITAELEGALQEGVNVALLASYSSSVPKVADVSASDKANRMLPDVKFSAVLAGAIHKTKITGTVSL